MRPDYGARFVRETMIVRLGAEVEDQVMMQMIGLAFVRWYAVNINASEGARTFAQEDAGLFDHFSAGGLREFMIFRLDVAAGQKPPIQFRVVD